MDAKEAQVAMLSESIVQHVRSTVDLIMAAAQHEAVDRLPADKVTSGNYQKLSEKTSPHENYADQVARLQDSIDLVEGALALIMAAGLAIDVVKKHVFYGKELDRNVPELRGLSHVLGSGAVTPRVPRGPAGVRLVHGVFGVSTEIGELVESFAGGELDTINLQEEVGDIHWYLAEMCNAMDVSMDAILEQNVRKLQSGRYADKFTEQEALQRNTSKEREILERYSGHVDTNAETS